MSLKRFGAFPLFALAETLLATESVFCGGNFLDNLLAVRGGDEGGSEWGGVDKVGDDDDVPSGWWSSDWRVSKTDGGVLSDWGSSEHSTSKDPGITVFWYCCVACCCSTLSRSASMPQPELSVILQVTSWGTAMIALCVGHWHKKPQKVNLSHNCGFKFLKCLRCCHCNLV